MARLSPAGAAVPMMAAVMSCFFATQDDPVPFIRGFLVWTIYSVPVSAFYLLAVLPAIHSFEMLVLACAPAFLLLGVLIAANIDLVMSAIEALFGFQVLPKGIYFIDRLPSDLRMPDVVQIGVSALILSLLATIYPSWKASRLEPAEALRYE